MQSDIIKLVNLFLALPGGISVAWCVLFYFTIWDKPDENPRISEAELRYLERELGDKGLAKEVSGMSQHLSESRLNWLVFCYQ